MTNPDPKDELERPLSDIDKFFINHYDKPISKPMWKQSSEARKALETLISERERVARENNLPSDCPTHGSGRFTHCCIANLNYNRQLQGGDNESTS